MILLTETDVLRLIDPAMALSAAEMALCPNIPVHAASHERITLRSGPPALRALTIMGETDSASLVVKTNLHAGTGTDKKSSSLLTLWDTETATPLALIASAGLNDHRTAAGFAVAARRMARPDASILVVFGAGKIAAPSVRYICRVRPIRRVLLVSRSPERATVLADALQTEFDGGGPKIELAQSSAEAAACADILVTVTTSRTPVFPGGALKCGALAILGGANQPDSREADDAFARRAIIVADDATSCTNGAGDIRAALASGALTNARLIDGLGRFRAEMRASLPADGVLGFKSMGLARQDAMLAQALLQRAKSRGVGLSVDGFAPMEQAAVCAAK